LKGVALFLLLGGDAALGIFVIDGPLAQHSSAGARRLLGRLWLGALGVQTRGESRSEEDHEERGCSPLQPSRATPGTYGLREGVSDRAEDDEKDNRPARPHAPSG